LLLFVLIDDGTSKSEVGDSKFTPRNDAVDIRSGLGDIWSKNLKEKRFHEINILIFVKYLGLKKNICGFPLFLEK
jgi:hypothetical protein